MTTPQYDIKTNIQIGQQVFENLPNDIRPGWAGLILSRFDNYIKNIPVSITELFPIIDTKDRWKEAHGQFNKIRRFLLDNKNYQPEAYLILAELVAKVTYNASGQPAPFDYDIILQVQLLKQRSILTTTDLKKKLHQQYFYSVVTKNSKTI